MYKEPNTRDSHDKLERIENTYMRQKHQIKKMEQYPDKDSVERFLVNLLMIKNEK